MKCCNNKRNGRSCVSTSATFASSFSDSGVHKLDPNLTINNIIVQPTFLYYGGDASASGWIPRIGNSAGTFGAPTGTGHTYNAGSPLLGSNDDSVKFSGNGSYRLGASETSFGDIFTEDYVLELIFQISSTSLHVIAKTITGAPGWRVTSNAGVSYFLHDGTTQASGGTGGLTAGSWNHVMIFVDRSASAQMYINGAVAGVAVDVSSIGSITGTNRFTIGAASDLGGAFNQGIAYVAMWQRDNWLDTHLQATVALERFNKLIGIYPQIAKGTATPTVQTRSSAAYLDKIESDGTRKLYQVGAGWLRCCSRNDANGVNVKGYLSEPPATNKQVWSEDLTQVPWNKFNTTISANSAPAPNGELTMDKLVEGAAGLGSVFHSVYHGATITAGARVLLCAFAKTDGRHYVWLGADVNGSQRAGFDLQTGAMTSVWNGTPTVLPVEDWGDGIYRIGIVATDVGGGSKNFSIGLSADGIGGAYVGDGASGAHFWGMSIVEGMDSFPSYIPTSATSATRTADALRYKGDDGNLGGVGSNQKGALVCDVLLPNVDVSADNYIYSLSDGGSASDAIILKTDSSDVPVLIGASTADGTHVSGSGNTDLWSNIKYNLKTTWQTNDYALFVSGSSSITDTSVPNPPDDIDRIDVGASVSSTQQTSGLIANLKIYGKPT